MLIDAMNQEVLGYFGVKLDKRDEYAVEYVSELLERYKNATNLVESTFVSGCGHRKSLQQKQYQELEGYLDRLKTYAHHIEVCGDERNSYSKTGHDATFMRIKRDYMGNDQLLPAYNLQTAVCDVYKNKYGRTEEIYECESCEGCQLKNDCCPKASKNRTIRMNQ
ncbi:hypothetical protein acsn021_30680 [Anaerocolumna cellulosilytica]|uniref:Uncharacterized protein n=1 Tax=Anaerocolumna cellulosilytica TaxID=433286 RepID=A0A6S6R2D2_9FIRM|nr:hypothetical protein [Anaerocolumna cellulosilytica]MBB5197480.1 hypothetical protein [Anaerocolumna cellulosilytica]BCJ95499.1 hypothetical protein acsn021_30680 [Anaerocolumna cellulosilytica]